MSIMSYSSCSSAGVVASSASLRHEQLYREGRHDLFSSEPLALIEQDMKLIKEQLFNNATASNTHETGTQDMEEQKLLLRKRLIHLEHERKRVLKEQERYWRRRSQRHLEVQTTAQDEQEKDENKHFKSSSDKVFLRHTAASSFRRASMLVEMKTGSLADVEEKAIKENQQLNKMISNALNDAVAAYLRKKMNVKNCSVAPAKAPPTHDIKIDGNGKNDVFQSAKTSIDRATTRSIYGAPPRPKKIQLAKAA